MSNELELAEGTAPVVAGWRPLRTFTADDLREHGWIYAPVVHLHGVDELWQHPARSGEMFTFEQAVKCEQVRESARWAKENG